jgi:hypothetical protein
MFLYLLLWAVLSVPIALLVGRVTKFNGFGDEE